MLASEMLKVVQPSAKKRKELYSDKLPGVMSRLQAAELIAKRIGLIKNDFFSISSNGFSWEYRRNLVIMKIISHALFRLEYNGLIKVFSDRVYIVAKKGPRQEHDIFGVISEVVSQVSDFMGGNVKRTAEQICDKCGCHDLTKKEGISAKLPSKGCKDIFFLVDQLGQAEAAQKAMGGGISAFFDISPITKAAAKDIIASYFMFAQNKDAFDKTAASMVITGRDPLENRLRLEEAARFDRYLADQVEKAKKMNVSELNSEFSLGPADVSPLFKGDEFKAFLNDARKLFKPGPADRASYAASLLGRLDPAGKEPEYFEDVKAFLDEFLAVCEKTVLDALNDRKLEVERLSPLEKRQVLARIKVAIADVMAEFIDDPVSGKLPAYFKYKHVGFSSAEKFFRHRMETKIGEIALSTANVILDPLGTKGDVSQPYDITYVISDLHLQDYPHRDTFELLRLIHMVVATGGTLVINGDFLDTWRAKNLQSIYMNNKTIFDALRKVQRVVIIKGNHDEWLGDLSGKGVLSENVSVRDSLWDRQVNIKHGNTSDKFNSQYLWIGRLATKIVKRFEDNPIIGPQIDTWVDYIAARVAPKWYWTKQKVDREVDGAIETYHECAENGGDYSPQKPLYAVMGHYHSAILFKWFRAGVERIMRELGRKMILLQTDSWFENQGYAGIWLAFAKKNDKGTGQLMVTSHIWEYPKLKELMTNYGNPNF